MSFDELRDAFHLRLGRLTQATAQLDLNIGLAVGWLGQNFKVPGWNQLPDLPDNGTKLTLKAFDQQIEALNQLNQDVNKMCDCRVAYVAPFSCPPLGGGPQDRPELKGFLQNGTMATSLSVARPRPAR